MPALLVRRTVDIEHGSEGPRHDPYGYDEITVRKQLEGEREHKTILHQGLAEWVEHDGIRLDRWPDDVDIQTVFHAMTGIPAHKVQGIIDKREHPGVCPDCGCKDEISMDGYPGETFNMCADCHHIFSTDFDRSAIE